MDPLKILEFEWETANEESATKHGYTTDEIEAAFTSRMWIRQSIGETYAGLVQLPDGRYVEIAFANLGGGRVRVFHCLEMKDWQRKLYEER